MLHQKVFHVDESKMMLQKNILCLRKLLILFRNGAPYATIQPVYFSGVTALSVWNAEIMLYIYQKEMSRKQ